MLKHGLQEWQTDPDRAGLRARHLTLSMAEDLLTRGCDVIVGQYLARADFIEDLQGLADAAGSVFAEFVLICDEQTLRARLEHVPERRSDPSTRSTHDS